METKPLAGTRNPDSSPMKTFLPAILVATVGMATVLALEVRPEAGTPALAVFPFGWSAASAITAASASGVRVVSTDANRLLVVADDDGGFQRLRDNGALFSVNALGLAGCFTANPRFGLR